LGNVAMTLLQVRPAAASAPSPVGATLKYNGLSMLTKVERVDGVTIENQYQHSGLRHFRKVTQSGGPTIETAYIYDEGKLIEEYRNDGAGPQLVGRYYYAHDDAPVAADLRHPTTGQLGRYYYLRDNTLSIVGVADAAGQVVERVIYDTFGQPAIEAADAQPPTIQSVIAGSGNSWLVVFSESIGAPLGNVGAGSALVTAPGTLANAITVVDNTTTLPVPGSSTLEEVSPGFGFSRVLRFTPSQVVTGAVSLNLPANAVTDEWGNQNSSVTISFTPSGPPGNVLFQATGVGDTGPQRLARSSVGNPFLFQGQYFDYDAGLVYMRARFYDPYTGQFLQTDPAGLWDSVNLYSGLANNPLSFRDPLGISVIRISSKLPRLDPPTPKPKAAKAAASGTAARRSVSADTRVDRRARASAAGVRKPETPSATSTSNGTRVDQTAPPDIHDQPTKIIRDIHDEPTRIIDDVLDPKDMIELKLADGTTRLMPATVIKSPGGRETVLVKTSRGPQAFYKSSGKNRGDVVKNRWLPHEGLDDLYHASDGRVINGWVNKGNHPYVHPDKADPLYGFSDEEQKLISDALAKTTLPEVKRVSERTFNQFLYDFGARRTPFKEAIIEDW
jgi:RHS repeat-associated protein